MGIWRYMERQSEQELLAIAPVETESLEGNRIYQVTGRELTQIAEISAREAVKMCREERKKTEKREQSNADKVKRTKKLLSDYRRLKREIPEKEEFTESEKVEKRWAFLRDLMGSAHINSQESVVEKEEKRRAENMYYINRIERAIETYREECETSKKPEAMRCYREVYEYYIAEDQILSLGRCVTFHLHNHVDDSVLAYAVQLLVIGFLEIFQAHSQHIPFRCQ